VQIKEMLTSNHPTLTSVKNVAIACDLNPEFRESMEDEELYMDKFGGRNDCGYFAVFDGHGGREVVEYVTNHLHKHLLALLEEHAFTDCRQCLNEAFLRMDEQIMHFERSGHSGCTAVIALVVQNTLGERWLYVANVGDARAVLNRNGQAVRLSYDHKASDPEEQTRIKNAGFFIMNGRLAGSLAVTRAFGDCELKKYGLITEPYITETRLEPDDTHLILACDGVWDVLSDQEAIDIIKELSEVQRQSYALLYSVLDKGTRDNVSVMVVEL